MGTTTTSYDPTQTTADVNAILQGMTDARIDQIQQRRAQLPPQVQAGYQTPLPTALQPPPQSNLPTPTSPQSQPQPSPLPSLDTGPQQQAGILPPQLAPRQPPVQLQPQPSPQPQPQPQPQQPVAPSGIDQTNFRDPTGRNNPGNMRGAGPQGRDFQRFPTMQAGLQALQNNLLAYQDRYGLNTIQGIISRWTPPNENNTEQAIQQASAVMNIDRNQRIDLHDPATMTAMTNAILYNEQHGTKGGGVMPASLNSLRDQMQLPTPQQNYTNAQPRDFGEWGRQPVGFGANQPGMMPRQSDFGRIMTGIAPLLVGIASLALRLPLSTAITAYGAMARAQQNGQELDYQRNRTRYQDQLKEATAQQTLESRAASDAFSEYGNNNPQGLQQALAQIALQYNDPAMFQMAEKGDLNGIYQMQQKRDALNQDLTKLHKAEQDEQDRRDLNADVAARDRKWDADERAKGHIPTPDEAAIQHDINIGLANADQYGPSGKGGTGAGEGETVHNVLDKDNKPTGRQVRLNRNGGVSDLNGQPTTINTAAGEHLDEGKGSGAAKAPTPSQTVQQSHLDAADAKTRQWVADEKAKGHDPTPDEIAIHRDQELDKTLQGGRAGGGELTPYSGPSTWPGSPNTPPPGDPDITPAIWSQALLLAQKGAPVPLGRNSPAAAAIRKAYPVAQEALSIDPADEAARSQKFAADSAAMVAVSRYFGAGQAATQMRSLNTVAGHIDLFRQYAEALKTGDERTLTKVGQAMAVELGHPEVTDFRVAATLMADEIVRLLTNTGGTRGDRDDMQHSIASNLSQGQLTGVADTAENFMHSRFEGLQQEWVHPPGVELSERDRGQRTAQFQEMMTSDARNMFNRGLRPIQGAGAPAISEEQYNAAPSGTRYRMPNDPPGTVRVKP